MTDLSDKEPNEPAEKQGRSDAPSFSVRLECLHLAVQSMVVPNRIVETASEMYDWLTQAKKDGGSA